MGHLVDYLQTLGNSEALQCLKPPGRVKPPEPGGCIFSLGGGGDFDLRSLGHSYFLLPELFIFALGIEPI